MTNGKRSQNNGFMSNHAALEELLLETSRRNTDFVADLIYKRPELFEDLFGIFAGNVEPVSRRAAWVVDTVSEKSPGLIESHLGELIGLLSKFGHGALKRHSLRILARSPLPMETNLGELIRICFEWLLSPKEAISVKVHCMEILYRVSQKEPDLKNELADSIEWRMNEENPGFRSRGQKILKKLNSEINKVTKPG